MELSIEDLRILIQALYGQILEHGGTPAEQDLHDRLRAVKARRDEEIARG